MANNQNIVKSVRELNQIMARLLKDTTIRSKVNPTHSVEEKTITNNKFKLEKNIKSSNVETQNYHEHPNSKVNRFQAMETTIEENNGIRQKADTVWDILYRQEKWKKQSKSVAIAEFEPLTTYQ